MSADKNAMHAGRQPKAADQPASATAPHAEASRPEQKFRVLVVDDIFDNREILTRRLTRRGFDVVEAEGGEEALDVIRKGTFDIVLLDIMMPDMSGNDVLRTIRQTMSPVDLPVIMVTGKSQSEDVVESLNLGANDYVTKPVDFAVALARINAQLERKCAAEAERASKREMAKRAADLQHVMEQKLVDLRETHESLAREVDERRRSEERWHHLSKHDALTGLLNRTAFRDLLNESLNDSGSGSGGPTLLFLDLDRFKAVNDVYGHEAGDRLLQEVSKMLRQLAGKTAPVARLGGDEFAIFVLGDGAPDTGVTLAERIVERLGRPVSLDGKWFQIGASCGVARASDCDGNLGTIVKAADLALARAKSNGRSRHAVFEPRMLEEFQDRNKLEIDLRRAIQDGALGIAYQPLISAATKQITAFEALARWMHPERGPISPEIFIPLAEETGQIVDLGRFVLHQACQEAATWPAHVRLAVNLSPLQFRDRNLVPQIREILAATALDPTRLELEITESGLLDAGEDNVAILRAIRELGIRVSLDDFGTGYSSMSYLQNFAFDKIKIDRRFVRDLKSGTNGAAIIKAIVELGTSIGIETTAEGVETEEERATVMAHGCTELQGYLFSRPLKAEDARTFVHDHCSGVRP